MMTEICPNCNERFELSKRIIYLTDKDLKKFSLYGKIEIDNLIIEKY